MIEKYGGGDPGLSEDQDYAKAASYCTQILVNCPGSNGYKYLKIEYLLRAHQLAEAESYTKGLIETMGTDTKIIAWRGRVLIYNG